MQDNNSIPTTGFIQPAEGKAVIYFARVTSYGGAISFEFFHNDKYIGIFKWKNYLRYELDPGQQLLWVSSENKEFLTGDLKAGGTYLVIVDVRMGFFKARVGLTPVTYSDTQFNRIKKLINEKQSVVTPPEKIAEMNSKLARFIPEQLEKYNNVWKAKKNFRHISAEMAIPENMLK